MSNPDEDREGASLVDTLRQSFERWRERLVGRGDLDGCDAVEVERIAAELGMSAPELRTLAAKGPDSAELLYRRMAALGLERTDVLRVSGALMQDLERTCSCCDARGQCVADLDARPHATEWQGYCPNTLSLQSVRKLKGRSWI